MHCVTQLCVCASLVPPSLEHQVYLETAKDLVAKMWRRAKWERSFAPNQLQRRREKAPIGSVHEAGPSSCSNPTKSFYIKARQGGSIACKCVSRCKLWNACRPNHGTSHEGIKRFFFHCLFNKTWPQDRNSYAQYLWIHGLRCSNGLH